MTNSFTRRNLLLAAGAAAGTAAGGALLAVNSATAAPAASLGSGPAASNSSDSPTSGTAFTHVTVIDPYLGRVQPDMTVVVSGDAITEVGRSGQVRIPAGAAVVDLRGKFLLPGLADMHTHAYAEQIDPALYVANGVTTVREMAGNAFVPEWRRKIEAGTLLGPRYTIGSKIIDGAPTVWDPMFLTVIQVADAAQARQAVRQVAADGADFVKVYSRVSPAAFRAIADECRLVGIPFAGHCPDEVPLTEAADLGQVSVEHLFWTPFDTSSQEARLRSEIARIRLEMGDYSGWFKALHPLEQEAVRTYQPSKARQVFDNLARRRTRQVPTLAMHYGLDYARTLDQKGDPRARYLPADVLDGMEFALQEIYLADRTPDEDAGWAAMYDYRRRMVGELYRAGVPLMVGTDTGTCGLYPGFSVHDELRLLVEAGLPPMAALQAATAEPAAFLGTRTGRIARDHAADLVVLGANPLTDITNTQRIEGVVARGRYLDAAARTDLLRQVEEAAGNTPEGTVTPAGGCLCHAPRQARVPAASAA